jgi:hypothetical protein
MMNGVPYNDSESQGTFFVNVPDLTSSASQILIQEEWELPIMEFLPLGKYQCDPKSLKRNLF